MDLLEFGLDYTQWDQTEGVEVTLTQRSALPPAGDPLLAHGPPPTSPAQIGGPPPAGQSFAVSVAKRTAVRTREKSPSGGVYTSGELNWRIPAALVPPGVRIEPGDVVTPADANRPDRGTRYTVLTADLRRQGSTWLLGVVDLILAERLRDRIWVEQPQVSFDGAGAQVRLYPTGDPPNGGQVLYAAIPARVQPLTQEIADQRGIRGGKGKFLVVVDRQLQIQDVSLCRLRLSDGSYLDVVDYHDAGRIEALPALTAERRP